MSATVPTTTRPIVLSDLPPVLTVKLAILLATDPTTYTRVTGRDPVTNDPIEQEPAA